MEEEAALPYPSSWNELPANLLYEITRRIPCKADRVRMLTVSRSWRTSLREPPVRPLTPQLPWLLRPSTGGPTFSCLLSGADEGSVHRFRVPDDLRAAGYFGSYEGSVHRFRLSPPYSMAIRAGLWPWWESLKYNVKNQWTLIFDKIWREEPPDAMHEESIKAMAFELDGQSRDRFRSWARIAVEEARWREPRLGPVLKVEFDDPPPPPQSSAISTSEPASTQIDYYYLATIGSIAVAGYVVVKYWLWR
uniref:F-box domain-containing protein n=1 Tax=Oryza brachyantha TaxID=4533 RepID=J3M9W7_ORYBR